MKISIRRGVFETNSSSVHSLTINNKKEIEKERKISFEDYKKDNSKAYSDCIDTKEDKIYFLAGAFICTNNEHFFSMRKEYKVFLRLLEDNKETKLLREIKKRADEYLCGHKDPDCSHYFDESPLYDCSCGFDNLFSKYFKVNLYYPKENIKEKELELYKKLSDFIYGDGVIFTYERL